MWREAQRVQVRLPAAGSPVCRMHPASEPPWGSLVAVTPGWPWRVEWRRRQSWEQVIPSLAPSPILRGPSFSWTNGPGSRHPFSAGEQPAEGEGGAGPGLTCLLQ